MLQCLRRRLAAHPPPIVFGGANAEQQSGLMRSNGGHGGSGGGALEATGPQRRGAPVATSSSFGVGDRTPLALAFAEEERRVARQKFMFDDMIVFEGGAIADNETLPKKLIMRDFIHHCLYHQRWGYYPRQFRKYRELLANTAHDPVPFGSLRNKHDYVHYLAKINDASPIYATPPQVFQPFYGWVFAEYFVGIMRAKFDPSEPLVIYDIGAGSATFAVSFLDHLAEQFPEVYDTCEYHLIEMNPQLIQTIRNKLVHHYHHVKIHNISILNWRELEPRRCFAVGIELMSSMPHDLITYATDYSCYEHWYDFISPGNLMSMREQKWAVTDPIILRYLRYLNWLQEDSFNALKVLCITDGQENISRPRWNDLELTHDDNMFRILTKMMVNSSPFHCFWLPTGSMLMFETLAQYFPRHHAMFADWNQVQQPMPGYQAPVCQVKMRLAKELYVRKVADTLDYNAGMVDICFPTEFSHLETVYRNICGEDKEVSNMTHPDFWKTHGGDKVAIFTAQSGYNPLLEDFAQYTIFTSHHPAER